MIFYKYNTETMNLLRQYHGGKLPARLSKEQFNLMIPIAQSGNIGVRNAIIESCYLMIYNIALKLWKPCAETDDLFQVGILGCIKAIDTFKTELDFSFTTYAYPVIANEMRIYLNALSGHDAHVISIDQVMYGDEDGSDVYLIDILEDDDIQNSPDLYLDAIITRELVLTALTNLRPSERKLIELRFGLNGERKHTVRELADIYDISRTMISNKIRAILFIIRKDLSF